MPVLVTPGFLSNRGEFYFQLATQVEAGLPLVQALGNQLANPLSPSFRAPLTATIARLEQGSSLTEALEAANWLPVFDLSLIRAGEESGRLDECFRSLAGYYRERTELSKRVIAHSIYPILVLHVAIIVFPPQALVDLIQGDPMPYLIQKLSILGTIYAAGLFFLHVVQREGGHGWQSLMERLLHRIPLLGSARRNLAFGRLAMALEALITAGVGIVQAWPAAARASGSPAIARAVAKAHPKMEHGWMPSDTLRELGIFPSHFLGLYQTGEQSGKMDETLRRLHTHYQDEGFRKMKHFAFWAPNVAYGVVAIFVAIYIIKFFLQYFKMIEDAIQ